MIVTTKTGDLGTTDIRGGRIAKADPLLEAMGDLDELIAEVLVFASLHAAYRPLIAEIVSDLSAGCAELAGYGESGMSARVERLEQEIHSQLKDVGEFRFHYPLDCPLSAQLNRLRTVCRRAERHWWALQESRGTDPQLGVYLNRLSDLFYALQVRAALPPVSSDAESSI